MAKLDEILSVMVEQGASDLHLTSSLQPYLRVDGRILTLDEWPPLDAGKLAEWLDEITPATSKADLKERWDTDFAYEAENIGRFRVNVFVDRFGTGAVLRSIPAEPLTADDLVLPKAVRDLCYLTTGLVVVTGPTGSGKSTTLAAMIDLINKTRSDHIITIEDPIEFVYKPQKCLVNQREVHAHTKSFSNAVRAALREDPDVILVGEMRDLETMEMAIEAAETGHLVLGTLHTNTAATTVERMIDKFPTARQNQIRAMLSGSLKAVIAQTLCARKEGRGRIAAIEVMIVTPGIASNIREGKTHQIPSAMQVGKSMGMQLLDDALMKLLKAGEISPEEAYKRAADKAAFATKMAAAGSAAVLSTDATDAPASDQEASGQPVGAKEREKILSDCLMALQRDPDNPDLLNNVAWIFATSANPELRKSEQALHTAVKAHSLTKGQHPGVLDTLGAAYASCGEFKKALESAKRGLKLARAMGEEDLAKALEERIQLYRQGKPLREE